MSDRYYSPTLPRRDQTRNYTVSTSQENFDLFTDLTESKHQMCSLIADVDINIQLSSGSSDTITTTDQDATNTSNHVVWIPAGQRYDFVIRGEDRHLHVIAGAAGNMHVWVSSQFISG